MVITFCHCFDSLCPGSVKFREKFHEGVCFGFACSVLLGGLFVFVCWGFFFICLVLSMSYPRLYLNCGWLEDMSQKTPISFLVEENTMFH